jgi:NitT/TauT family transport system permease protein
VEEKMLWSGAAMGCRAPQRMVRHTFLPAALPNPHLVCPQAWCWRWITMVTSGMIARQSGARQHPDQRIDMGQYDTSTR